MMYIIHRTTVVVIVMGSTDRRVRLVLVVITTWFRWWGCLKFQCISNTNNGIIINNIIIGMMMMMMMMMMILWCMIRWWLGWSSHVTRMSVLLLSLSLTHTNIQTLFLSLTGFINKFANNHNNHNYIYIYICDAWFGSLCRCRVLPVVERSSFIYSLESRVPLYFRSRSTGMIVPHTGNEEPK